MVRNGWCKYRLVGKFLLIPTCKDKGICKLCDIPCFQLKARQKVSPHNICVNSAKCPFSLRNKVHTLKTSTEWNTHTSTQCWKKTVIILFSGICAIRTSCTVLYNIGQILCKINIFEQITILPMWELNWVAGNLCLLSPGKKRRLWPFCQNSLSQQNKEYSQHSY